jgi:F420-0:gamma-glutamyl ligase-like protein
MGEEMKVKVWTMGYFPFTVGGNVWQPIKAEVEATGPHELGKGFKGYLCTSPSGRTKVAEASTGAIVGDTLIDVMKDIADCDDIEFMNKQVRDATREMKQGHDLTTEDFWNRLEKAIK